MLGFLNSWRDVGSKSNAVPSKEKSNTYESMESIESLESLDIEPPESYWGSKEEFEVEFVLQKIVTFCNTMHCDTLLHLLRDKLSTSSTGWVDRFVSNQGILVLHKLLQDSQSDEILKTEREHILMQCMNIVFERAVLARQLLIDPFPEDIIKSIQKALISPLEETRILASQTVLYLKAKAGAQSRVLQLLTLPR